MFLCIKPLNPSRTLANFLDKNTPLPFLVWTVIFNFKYEHENNELEYEDKKPLQIHRLRSGKKYLSRYESLYEKLIYDANRLFNGFADVNSIMNIKKKNNSFKLKMLYNTLYEFVIFVTNWIHYILQNSHKHKSMLTLINSVRTAISRIILDTSNITCNNECKYKYWIKFLRQDIIYLQKYLSCDCGWHTCSRNTCKKCQDCKHTEHYMYNYHSYRENFIILRNGKYITKPEAFNIPVSISNIYMIV